MSKLIQIHADDNVAVALVGLERGASFNVANREIVTQSEIPRGHKVAIQEIEPGTPVIKFGFPVGRATEKIAAGDWVHTHNLVTALGETIEYQYHPALSNGPPEKGNLFSSAGTACFQGYPRAQGGTGTRNEIWIINTVACVNNSAERIARLAHEKLSCGNVDGVYSFSHPYGCSQLGDDLKNTQRVLAGLVKHQNAGGVLVLGLGCENNAIKYFIEEIGGYDPERVKFLNAQDVEDEIEEGLRLIDELATYAGQTAREARPLSELVLGMKCGGSDGMSGITANPLVGRISDVLTASSGTAIITEVPEMFGAEQLLMNRARDEETFRRVVRMINGFKDYYHRHHQPIYENPSPGNKEGGITTLEEKSLGAVQKGGRAVVTEVLSYGERAREKGLVLLEAPGNDGISSTAEVVAGANLILFTTGRGTPLGVPVPTIKIATNTELAHRKPNWIDFDAGVLANEAASIDETAHSLFDFIVKVASGEVKTNNELNGFREIAIFKTGVTL